MADAQQASFLLTVNVLGMVNFFGVPLIYGYEIKTDCAKTNW